MARLTDALIDSKAYSLNAHQPMLDLKSGGMHGYAPDLTQWISNQAYVRRNLVCILLEAPRFFNVMPNPEKWTESLKALVELHARTWEGFNAGLTVELDEHPVGGGGEMQQEFTDVKRARTEPVMGVVEKYGNPIQTLLSNWIQYGIMDPDTKYALVGTLSENRPADLLADWYSMSCLFLEPDPTHRKVVKSWVTTNMFPKGTGEIIGKRDLTSAGEVNTLSVEWTGISQFSLGTNVFAQSILDSINITKANPYNRPSFVQAINSEISADSMGYKKNVDDLASKVISGISR